VRDIRITSTARKHKLSSGRIREALATAAFVETDGDMAIYVGTDSRGLEIELGIVKDDRGTGFAVIHAMPRGWRR
jgi:hypothetical protein